MKLVGCRQVNVNAVGVQVHYVRMDYVQDATMYCMVIIQSKEGIKKK